MHIRLTSLNRGFSPDRTISDASPVVEKTGQFTDKGVFSERIFGRLPSTGRDYACDCGTMEGRFYEGMTCSSCGSVVSSRDTVFSRRGWIDLGENQVINPIFHAYFCRVIGPTQLSKIIHQKRVLTVDGTVRHSETAGGPYDNLGLVGFARDWREILDYYESKRKSDARVVEFARLIRENGDLVMTSKIPVFNHILRPALVVEKTVIFAEVNSYYNLIISSANALRDYSEHERTEDVVNMNLANIQARFLEVFDHVLHIFSQKGGYLRGDILGVRVNFSARAVITPLPPGHAQDEVTVPYLTFLELYRFQLTNLLARVNNVPLHVANELWSRAQTRFDRTVYAMMRELIRKGGDDANQPGLPALLNRNPSIAFGSIMRVRITGVKKDVRDLTLSVHNGILGLCGGDYDGCSFEG